MKTVDGEMMLDISEERLDAGIKEFTEVSQSVSDSRSDTSQSRLKSKLSTLKSSLNKRGKIKTLEVINQELGESPDATKRTTANNTKRGPVKFPNNKKQIIV